jgi:hypothetical protein
VREGSGCYTKTTSTTGWLAGRSVYPGCWLGRGPALNRNKATLLRRALHPTLVPRSGKRLTWRWATAPLSCKGAAPTGTAEQASSDSGLQVFGGIVCASRAKRPEDADPAASAMLNASSIGKEAEMAALSLPLKRERVFESYYAYLTVDEPAVHLMPLHFLPHASREQVGEGALRELAVAGKLEYARNRWLDEMVDHHDSAPGLSSAHRLNDALITLITSRYARVLAGAAAASFFPVLSVLHARHGLSLILDGARFWGVILPITMEEYAEHATTRHGPVRAPVDAVLLLTGAGDDLLQRARSCWHNWALGVQFYDDALDIEEDFRNRNLTWVVGRALEYFHRAADNPTTQRMPDLDTFYQRALAEGVVSEALSHAESFFAESARLAEPVFPSWVPFQEACASQAWRLREDYEELVREA